jgi:hypothetical protein
MMGQTNADGYRDGQFVRRSPTINPSSGGWGITLTRGQRMATEFGLLHRRRAQALFTVSSLRVGPPYIPFDPDGLNPTYFTEYPKNIRMYGATFNTKFRGSSVFGELTYRPNQPLQYNAIDLLNAFLSPLLPSPLRAQADATAPGEHFSGFERHDFVQAQLGATGTLRACLVRRN